MLFVTVCKATAPMRERTARRLDYAYPDGIKVVAEYWLQAPDPSVILVTECDDIGPMMSAIAAWDDVFDISVFPAITAEDGLRLTRESMVRGAA